MLNRNAEAAPLFRRGLMILENLPGKAHPDIGTAFLWLAKVCRDVGKHGEAESLLQRSLAIGEKVQRPDHPTVGSAQRRLAEIYFDQKKYNNAESLLRSSLTIFEKGRGPEHIDVANTLNALAYFIFSSFRPAIRNRSLGFSYLSSDANISTALGGDVVDEIQSPEKSAPESAKKLEKLSAIELENAQGTDVRIGTRRYVRWRLIGVDQNRRRFRASAWMLPVGE